MEKYFTLKTKLSRLSSYSTSRLMQLKIPKLEKLLDELCTTIVILRDQECVICGTRDQLTNGHFIRRAHRVIRWNLENCNCQCVMCNNLHEEDDEPYTTWMLKHYGVETVRRLTLEVMNHVKLTREHRMVAYWKMCVVAEEILGADK